MLLGVNTNSRELYPEQTPKNIFDTNIPLDSDMTCLPGPIQTIFGQVSLSCSFISLRTSIVHVKIILESTALICAALGVIVMTSLAAHENEMNLLYSLLYYNYDIAQYKLCS